MSKKSQYAEIGSISHGTMREEDLIPAFMDTLRALDRNKADALQEDNADVFEWLDGDTDEATDDQLEAASIFLNETLWNALDEYAPPYCYFGSHPGDGADYGFWPSMESIDEDARFEEGVIKIETGDEWPDDMDGIDYVAEVSDHGNVTLYDAKSKEEIWSVV